jgi:hypothetical protein
LFREGRTERSPLFGILRQTGALFGMSRQISLDRVAPRVRQSTVNKAWRSSSPTGRAMFAI